MANQNAKLRLEQEVSELKPDSGQEAQTVFAAGRKKVTEDPSEQPS